MENIKIVELIKENNETVIQDIEEELAPTLAKEFLKLLREGIEERDD